MGIIIFLKKIRYVLRETWTQKPNSAFVYGTLRCVYVCVCASGLFMYGRRDGAAGHVPDTQARPYLLSNDLFPKQPLVFPSSTRPGSSLLFNISILLARQVWFFFKDRVKTVHPHLLTQRVSPVIFSVRIAAGITPSVYALTQPSSFEIKYLNN